MSQLERFVELMAGRLWAVVIFEDPAKTGKVFDAGGFPIVGAEHVGEVDAVMMEFKGFYE